MLSIPDRIVNLVQRQVRPIVCGKARAAFEFGALARRASACGSLLFFCGMALPPLRRISWDADNESGRSGTFGCLK